MYEKTKLIAHRGYSEYERENTLAAFMAASEIENFYGMETDVHVTKDNHYVLIHDADTGRVSNHTSAIDVEKSTFEEVRAIYLPGLKEDTPKELLQIPTMEEYFTVCKENNKKAVFELKQDFTVEQLNEIIKRIKDKKMLDDTIFISFHLNALIKLRTLLPHQPIQYLLCEIYEDTLDILIKYNFGLDVEYKALSKEYIELLHQHNLPVNAWTVNDLFSAQKLASWGIDYITTNCITSLDENA